MITKTPYGRSANVSNISGEKIYLSFCKAEDFVEWDTLAVSDICVLLPGKVRIFWPYFKLRFIENGHVIIETGRNSTLCFP